jgi:hypothetical protein
VRYWHWMLKKPCAAAPLGIRDTRLPRRLELKWLALNQDRYGSR